MMKSRIGRMGALLSGLALAGASALGAAGTASASTDGGCGDTSYAHACISMEDGVVHYSGYTDFAKGSGKVHLMLWDYTEVPGGVVVFTTDFPVATGPHHYRPGGLANPARGHDYKAEMRVDWGVGKDDVYLSPDLFA
ncbi:hypothetical protein [Nocardia sp. NPDC019395]|uniref:hypothetical protein n=1 Tax=Nocardia sp. NPDC019395 TaxID=3154686 RepID=UPI0033E21970